MESIAASPKFKKVTITKKLNYVSMCNIVKYFKKTNDYLNIIQVNSKYKTILEQLRYNPISNTKLFQNITEQHLYYRWDKRIENIKKYVVCYKVSYSDYKKYHKKNIEFKYIEYTEDDINKYGINIPHGVTNLKERLFEGSDIETLTLPNTVKHIGYNCFSRCFNLKQIELPNSIISIGSNCFDHCTSIQTISIPQSVQTIGYNCFYCCFSLQSITLPNDLVYIGTSCFYGCELLQHFHLPSHLKNIKKSLFLPSSFLIA
ncbi:Leucine rich repeat protein bspa family [Entamoeba marina]